MPQAAAAKVSGAAAAGMSAGASGGEAVAVGEGEGKEALLQRLRKQVRGWMGGWVLCVALGSA